jgi:hypothetical protein
MAEEPGFFPTVWLDLRPHAVSAAVDFGRYVIVWSGVLIAQVVKVIAAASGVELQIIETISFMERWVWIATFAAFFWRILIRLWRSLQK